MADYRSNSYAGDGRMQIQSYYGGHRPTSNPHDFRSFNASYVCYPPPPQTQMDGVKGLKLKKRKSSIGSSSKSWGLKDPEFQRKKRVASYKAYAVEGKVKGSLRKSFKWLKDREKKNEKFEKKHPLFVPYLFHLCKKHFPKFENNQLVFP